MDWSRLSGLDNYYQWWDVSKGLDYWVGDWIMIICRREIRVERIGSLGALWQD